jgi:hypothetical protein
MLQLRNQGMVSGEDGDKMSKSKGNVIAPMCWWINTARTVCATSCSLRAGKWARRGIRKALGSALIGRGLCSPIRLSRQLLGRSEEEFAERFTAPAQGDPVT